MSEPPKKKTVKVCHCPSCGTISINRGLGRVHACPECKHLIGVKDSEKSAPKKTAPIKATPMSLPNGSEGKPEAEEHASSTERSNQRRKKRSSGKRVNHWKLALTVLGVFFLMVGLVTYFFWNKLENKEIKLRKTLDFVQNNPEGMAEERVRRVNSYKKAAVQKELPAMAGTLISFFRNKETKDRWEHIYASYRQAGAMSDHYKRGISIGDGKSENIRLKNWDLTEVDGRSLAVTVWNTDGGPIGAVFVKTGLGWKLDWRFLERYSEGSWVLFFGDVGTASEGGFRAYLRLRSIQNAGKWDISVHRPNDYLGTYDSDPAVSLSVDKESEAGKKLTLLFEDEKALGGRTLYKEYDKDNCYRAQILLEKETDAEGETLFKLKDVLAANWLDGEFQQKVEEPAETESEKEVSPEESLTDPESAEAP